MNWFRKLSNCVIGLIVTTTFCVPVVSFQQNGYVFLSENERCVLAIGAGILGGSCGVILCKKGSNKSFLGLVATCFIGTAYFLLEKVSPSGRCRSASRTISKILDDGILIPVIGKKFKQIDVQKELECHFVTDNWPLLSAQKYLKKVNRDLDHVLNLADAVIKVLKLDTAQFEESVDKIPFEILLDSVSWGFNGDVDAFFIVALKQVCYRFRDTSEEAQLAVIDDVQFQEQYETFQESTREVA
ncbi:hypothetical protein KAU11_01235 [Candidatus Babeliales bacterium]|nr:hypothetical protein [Candidatus Babeliales bacterium]